ncbi:MAG: helix-turn-helix transcriptional regulator [Pseudomonadota bacterium]
MDAPPFRELTKGYSKERKARIAEKVSTLREEMVLADLRKQLGVTQAELAEKMGRSQATIAEMEKRDDMKLSNLRRVIESLGGKLKVSAEFPDGEVRIVGLGDNPAP